jgi:enoyl-CoA hydratase
MTGAAEAITIERNDGVCIVTLNRGDRLNAADRHLHGALTKVWSDAAADPGTGAIVITGSGRAFSAGGDMELLQAMTDDVGVRAEVLAEGAAIVRAMVECPLPIVAAVNGPAVGLGFSLVSLSDLVVMAESAFFADPHVSIGLVAGDGGAITLPLLASLLRAKEFVLLGDRISAGDALRLGLANRVVPGDEVLPVALELAARMAGYPRQAVVETRRLLNLGLSAAVEAGLDGALAAESASFTTPEFQANLAALRARQSS